MDKTYYNLSPTLDLNCMVNVKLIKPGFFLLNTFNLCQFNLVLMWCQAQLLSSKSHLFSEDCEASTFMLMLSSFQRLYCTLPEPLESMRTVFLRLRG